MDIIAAYREGGTYRGAADIAGTTHKTVKRVIERHEAGTAAPPRVRRGRDYDGGPSWSRAGEEDCGSDLGEAAAARRPGGGVSRVGPELPPPGRGVQAGVAAGSSPGTMPCGVVTGGTSGSWHGVADTASRRFARMGSANGGMALTVSGGPS